MYCLPATNPESLSRDFGVSSRLSRLLQLTPQFDLLDGTDPRAETARLFVGQIFAEAFGAKPDHFLPQLLTLHCAKTLSGVVGIGLASRGPLFLEQYLDNPIECHLKTRLGIEVPRQEIVEIGNLVALNNGGSLALFIVLASALHTAGHQYLVFTATRQLREKFKRLGFATELLAGADEGRLNDEQKAVWGSYYEQDPKVMLGSLDAAVELIQRKPLFRLLQFSLQTEIDSVIKSLDSRQ